MTIFSAVDPGDPRATLAIHEAAHIVAGEIGGIRILNAEIGAARLGNTVCNAYVLIERIAASDFEVARTFAAGQVAEEFFTGYLKLPWASDSDMDQIDWFCLGDEEILQFVLFEARKLVREYADSIGIIANALLKQTVLDREAIRAALESAGVQFIEQNGEGLGVRLRKVAK